ncbi:galanin receptor 2a-like [Argopecten irradians]|uniref:galanin receptor 2a-like n=1 Tax=Argopecten irradians TaxID=31199 RepID=UPI00371FF523
MSATIPPTTFGYNTTVNSTWPVYHGNHSHVKFGMTPDRILRIKARHIPAIVVSVPSNLFIIAIILGNKNLRTQAFFLGVLSISIFDLCNGVFVLPMSMEHQLHWATKWNHGQHVCTAFQIIVYMKTFLSSLMNIAICFERLLSKLKSEAIVSQKTASTMAGALIALPWGIGAIVCAPILLDNRMDMRHVVDDQYCLFVLEQSSLVPILVTMHLVPLVLLFLVPIVMLVVYKYKNLRWHRFPAEDLHLEVVSLQMSTLSALVASLIYLLTLGPITIVITMFVMCMKPLGTDCPTGYTYENAYTVSILSSAITPFVWTITIEVRDVLSSLKSHVVKLVAPSDGRKNVLSFSSLRNKMSHDDTAVLS